MNHPSVVTVPSALMILQQICHIPLDMYVCLSPHVMQCNAVEWNGMEWNAMQCNVMQQNVM